MSPSRRAKIAGILAVIVAGICLVGGIMTLNVPGGGTIFLLIAVTFAIMGIPPILGGVYALRRKRWRRAVTCSLFAIQLWGIGIIPAFLISSAKDEFTGKN